MSDLDEINEDEDHEDADPMALAQTAFKNAVATIKAADDDPIERMKAELDVVDAFTDAMADAKIAGLSDSTFAVLCGRLADHARESTKTSIKSDIKQTARDRAAGDSSDQVVPINVYLEDNVCRVEAVRSTDSHQPCIYRWLIDDNEYGRYEIETGDGAEGTHYHWRPLRKAIAAACGRWCGEPPDEIADGVAWETYIGDFVSRHETEIKTVGKRTLAVEDLRNHIGRSVAYALIADAVDHNGIGIDDDPDDGEPTEIWIRTPDIVNIADEHGVELRALQVELKARGHTVDRLGDGVSEQTHVHGDWVSYWVIDAGFAEVGEYEPEP